MNHSYWSYVHQLSYRPGASHCSVIIVYYSYINYKATWRTKQRNPASCIITNPQTTNPSEIQASKFWKIRSIESRKLQVLNQADESPKRLCFISWRKGFLRRHGEATLQKDRPTDHDQSIATKLPIYKCPAWICMAIVSSYNPRTVQLINSSPPWTSPTKTTFSWPTDRSALPGAWHQQE